MTPDAYTLCFLTGKEDVFHIGRIDWRIILVAIGNLPAYITTLCIGLENLVAVPALLRETDILAIG